MNGALVRTPHITYDRAWGLQRRLADLRAADRIPDVVWLLEHSPTFTMGRHGDRSDLFLSDEALASMGASFHQADRGGQMTWHGPGQTTGYVIRRLGPGSGVRAFVTVLLEAMAEASRLPGARVDAESMGVYVEGRKLGSVGIRVRDRITYHGLALNRDPDLGWYDRMTACGAPGVTATSIHAEGGDADRARVEARLADALAVRLGLRLTDSDMATLLGEEPSAGGPPPPSHEARAVRRSEDPTR